MADLDLEKGIHAASLSEGQPIAAQWRGEDLVVVRHGGKVCALSGKCTHLQAPMTKGLVANGQIRCPFHHARFDLDTGEAVSAPAFAPLEVFEVVTESGTLRVTGKAKPAKRVLAHADIGRVVIIGGGAAGHACAEMLARHDACSNVTLLSADDEAPYDRSVCSKDYLAGKMERKDVTLPALVGERGAVTLRQGGAVERISVQDKMVETRDGERISYDTLVLATGASPLVPHFTGNDRDDVFRLRTLENADALIAAADRGKKVIIVGSSYIGLEAAASLVQRGLSVTIVSQGDTPPEKTAGRELGSVLQQLHESKGVIFHMGREIRAWDGAAATLDDGMQVEGDFLLLGTGVAPDTDLAAAAGLSLVDPPTAICNGGTRRRWLAADRFSTSASLPERRAFHDR